MRQLGAALARWLIIQDVTEDICGASVVTTWLRGKQATKALDIFESIAPPRRGPSSAPAPDVVVAEVISSAPPIVDSSSPAPSPTHELAETIDSTDVQAGIETERPEAAPTKEKLEEDGAQHTDEAAVGRDKPAAAPADEAPQDESAAAEAVAEPKRKRSAIGRLLTWVLLLGLLGAAAWAWHQHHARLGLPPPPWVIPPADPATPETAPPTGRAEPPAAPTLLPDPDPTPALSVEVPTTTDDADADPAASASASAAPTPKPPPRRWRRPSRPVDIYE
jgi:hypothetical protein